MSTSDTELKRIFLDDADQLLLDADQHFMMLEKVATDPGAFDAVQFTELCRILHNIKGSAAAFGFLEVSKLAHHMESLVVKLKGKELNLDARVVAILFESVDQMRVMAKAYRQNVNEHFNIDPFIMRMTEVQLVEAAPMFFANNSPAQNENAEVKADVTPVSASNIGGETIRVSLERLEMLVDQVGELVVAKTALSNYKDELGLTGLDRVARERIGVVETIVRELQFLAMTLRMTQLKQTFQKMQRIVRDISAATGKEVIFFTTGDETEIDKTIIEQLGDPLMHLIRNAVDHGIEPAEERIAAGKPSSGTLRLSARHHAGQVVIEVRDDGRGLDAAKLVASARTKGLALREGHISNEEAYELIFASGFSTKSEVTDISGRGVGMDVVRSNIQALQGTIQIETELGKGTCFRIIVPLSLAIMDGMIVRVGDERYVLPHSSVSESLRPDAKMLEKIGDSAEILCHRGARMPLFRLSVLLGRAVSTAVPGQPDPIAIVMRDLRERPFSLLVDDILCSQQVVLKKLGGDLDEVPGIAGGAVLGDGQAALVLDLQQIIEAVL